MYTWTLSEVFSSLVTMVFPIVTRYLTPLPKRSTHLVRTYTWTLSEVLSSLVAMVFPIVTRYLTLFPKRSTHLV